MLIQNFFLSYQSFFLNGGHEVHIITGNNLGDALVEKLKKFGMEWTELYSISSYHEEVGTEVNYAKEGNPWMECTLWDKSKAEYCERENINFHIDNSKVYGDYFKTTYCLFFDNWFNWSYLTKYCGKFPLLHPEQVFRSIKLISMGMSL